jgi:hypothetical protein
MARVASLLGCLVGLIITDKAISMDSPQIITGTITGGVISIDGSQRLTTAQEQRWRIVTNEYDQLHELMDQIVNPEATVPQIDALLARGVDLEKFSIQAGEDLYECGRKYGGESPEGLPVGKNQHFGNKGVMDYIFCEMLSKKLEKLAVIEHKG